MQRLYSPCSWHDADPSKSWRRQAASFLALAILAISMTAQRGMAQGTATAKEQAAEEKTLAAEDNQDLKITYYKGTAAGTAAKDTPVVVLLHGKGGQRRQWTGTDNILQPLHSGGYAVVTVDLRGHGDSPMKRSEIKKNDYLAMAEQDMKAVKDFLFQEHQKGQLNMNKLGIVACDFSASVALAFAAADWEIEPYDDGPDLKQRTPRGQDVQALVLISPDTSTPGLFATKAALALRTMPLGIMIVTSEKNNHDNAMAKKLFDQLNIKKGKDSEERFALKKSAENLHGMDLLKDKQVRANLYEFLGKYVKNHQSTWIDRRSRLERE